MSSSAGGQRLADRGLGELVAIRPEHPSTSLQAAVGKRDVGGDDDVARPGLLGDPVVGRAETGPHDQFDPRIRRHPQRGVRDDFHGHGVAPRDPVDLVLDRAGVGVDVDGEHAAHYGSWRGRRHRSGLVGGPAICEQ